MTSDVFLPRQDGRHSEVGSRRLPRTVEAAHVFALCGFALAQPLLDLLSRNAEFFVVRRSTPADIVLLVLVLCLGVPAAAVAAEWVAGLLHRRLQAATHIAIVGLLIAVTFLPVLKRVLPLPGVLLLGAAAALGVLTVLAYRRLAPVRSLLSLLSPAPLVFAAVFLLHPQIRTLLSGEADAPRLAVTAKATAPIVMVVFDELNGASLMDEHRAIDSSRYPNFAALAREATWFRNATTVSASTLEAMTAMLTGNHSLQGRLPLSSNYPHNIFTLLESGYRMNVLETMTRLCPARACQQWDDLPSWSTRAVSLASDLSFVYLHIVLPADLSAFLPSVTQNWMNFGGRGAPAGESAARRSWEQRQGRQWAFSDDRRRRFLRFVSSIERTPRPTFNFLHILLPHVPYEYLPSGKSYGTAAGLPGLTREQWSTDETLVLQAYQRYLLQLGFVDTLLGMLLDHLHAIGLYDEALIVVTADHGVGFLPGEPRRGVNRANGRSLLPVPLFVKAPGQSVGVVSDRNVEIIDIVPTMADVLVLPLPWATDGQSGLDPQQPKRQVKRVWSEGRALNWEPRFEVKYASLQRKIALFGSGAGDEKLFRIGPYRNLIGRPFDPSVPAARGLSVAIDHHRLFDRVDLDAEFLPAFVSGVIRSAEPNRAPLDLAIGLNGRIVALATASLRNAWTTEFSAVLPEGAFRNGKNQLEMFAISGGASSPRLARLDKESVAPMELEVRGADITIVPGSGPAIEVDGQTVRGGVDYACASRESIVLDGWAADATQSRLVDGLLLFVDGKLIHSGRTNLARPDVVTAFRAPELLNTGFAFEVRMPDGKDGRSPDVRLFGVSGVSASELRYTSACTPDDRRAKGSEPQ